LKTKTLFICLLFSCLLEAQVTFNPSYLDVIAKGERDIHARKSSLYAGANSSAYNVTYYSCFWIIDPAVKQISGSVLVQFKPLIAGFDSLVLDMNLALQVDSV
jgi:hypothetical protein